MPSVPDIIQALVEHLPGQGVRFEPFQRIALDGTVIPPAMLELCTNPAKLGAKFACAGFGLSEGLSMFSSVTEETPMVEGNFASVGRIALGGLTKVCTPESRQTLRRGEVRELYIGGPMVINGYRMLIVICFTGTPRDSKVLWQETRRK